MQVKHLLYVNISLKIHKIVARKKKKIIKPKETKRNRVRNKWHYCHVYSYQYFNPFPFAGYIFANFNAKSYKSSDMLNGNYYNIRLNLRHENVSHLHALFE